MKRTAQRDAKPIFNAAARPNWLAVAEAVNARLGTKHSANFVYQVHTGRQSSEVVRLAIVEIMEAARARQMIAREKQLRQQKNI